MVRPAQDQGFGSTTQMKAIPIGYISNAPTTLHNMRLSLLVYTYSKTSKVRKYWFEEIQD